MWGKARVTASEPERAALGDGINRRRWRRLCLDGLGRFACVWERKGADGAHAVRDPEGFRRQRLVDDDAPERGEGGKTRETNSKTGVQEAVLLPHHPHEKETRVGNSSYTLTPQAGYG